MNLLVLNAALALGWAALMGTFSLASLLIGFVISYAALWVLRPMFGQTTYFERVWRGLRLAALFIYELIVSSLRVVWDVVTPTHLSRPGIIAMPLDATGDGEILLVASLISLTPGTLSLDVSADKKTLYVHAMFIDDPEKLCRQLKDGMERWVIEAVE
jgi:multicomponent Na+:H+ antiporter subunit E